jgi:hypothetical protein
MKAREDRIKSLDAMYIHLRPGSKLNTDLNVEDIATGVTGSFRKLEVD